MTVKAMIDKEKEHSCQNNQERSIKDEHSGNGEQKRNLLFQLRDSVKTIILLIAVLFIIIGILGHQPDSVLAKAIRICLECVGIG